jgi:two-component system, chemotaxis family, protein-glutamate methylesterase/glutaminase
MDRVLKVLVVDDSAYVRKVVKQMLSRSPFLEVVGTARDGREALELVGQLDPDVVTCDLIMPELDGVGFVREQMARRPVPIIIMSIASETGEAALTALDAGAVDFVQKPTALATEKMFEVSDELIEKVKAAADIPMARVRITPPGAETAPPEPPPAVVGGGSADVVVIGISTGGPQALKQLIPQLPADFPAPVAMVMHMPVGYTEMYARKLDEQSPLEVREAREGDVLRAGVALLAPAGRHLTFRRLADGSVVAHLDSRPFEMPHKAQGGLVYTESEETCVVYGMPHAVVEAGLSDRSVPLDKMARAIREAV